MQSLLEVEAADVVRSARRYRSLLERVQGLPTCSRSGFGVGACQSRAGARENEAVASSVEGRSDRGLWRGVLLLRCDGTRLPGARSCQWWRLGTSALDQGISTQRLPRREESRLPTGVPTSLSQLQRRQAHLGAVST